MTDNALIVSIEKSQILVKPLVTGACINCEKSGCAKQGKPFSVSNSQGFPISVGSVVKLKASKKLQIVQGFVALFSPILVAVGMYFLFGFFALKFGWQQKEVIQALSVVLGLIVSSLTIYFVTGKNTKMKKCEICEVVA